jgi:hypothetical protein
MGWRSTGRESLKKGCKPGNHAEGGKAQYLARSRIAQPHPQLKVPPSREHKDHPTGAPLRRNRNIRFPTSSLCTPSFGCRKMACREHPLLVNLDGRLIDPLSLFSWPGRRIPFSFSVASAFRHHRVRFYHQAENC